MMLVERLVLERVGPFEHLDLGFREGRDPEQADVHLLVGPNGCGKSTILYALAQLCAFQHQTPIWPRLWGPDSIGAAVREGDWKVLANSKQAIRDWTPPEGGKPKPVFLKQKGGVLGGSQQQVLVIAYSGYREPKAGRLLGIVEPDPPPADQAVSFGDPNATLLKQWIGSQKAKAAWALARKDEVAAREREATVRAIESALEAIVGTKIVFVLQEDPIEVFLRVAATELDLNVLPDGLKSVLSWLGDLLMRLEHSHTDKTIPVTHQPFVLLLDEIEVHLHPEWQRRVVPAVQRLFPNAQVFIATHSPFVVASADDAWVYPFRLDDEGLAHAEPPLESQLGHSYAEVLQDVFGVTSDFDPDTEHKLANLLALRDRALKGEDVSAELNPIAEELAERSSLLANIVGRELRVIESSRRKPA